MGIERIVPTKDNLEEVLIQYPDHKLRYYLLEKYIKDLKCADIACGSGYGSYIMSDFASSVDGFDISMKAIDHAKNNFSKSNISFHHSSEFINKKYDAIVSLETIEHMNETDGDVFLKTITQNLKKNGLFIISTEINNYFNKKNYTAFHLREYSNKEFEKKLNKNGFNVTKWYGLSNIVSRRLTKSFLGISLENLIKFNIHILIPKIYRNYISNKILKKNTKYAIESCKIQSDNLVGCFCQIAICRLSNDF